MTDSKVSIIIINWNGLQDTIELLKSIEKLTYPNYDVIVVDNGSKGNDAEVLEQEFGDDTYVIKNDRNYGVPTGLNIGISYALNNLNPTLILLLDNDIVVEPGCLTKLVRVIETDPTIGITGAKIYSYYYPKKVNTLCSGKINLWMGEVASLPKVLLAGIKRREIDRGRHNAIEEVDWLTSCCVLITKEALKNVGKFDERYFYGWEDTDYCFRARRAGYKIIRVPTAEVWHKGGGYSGRVNKFSCYCSARSRFLFTKKHSSDWQYRCFLIYFFGFYVWLASGYYLIFYHSPKLLLSYWKGIIEGLSSSEGNAELSCLSETMLKTQLKNPMKRKVMRMIRKRS